MAAAPALRLRAVASHIVPRIIALLTLAALLITLIGSSQADKLVSRSLYIDNELPSASANYKISFTIPTTGVVGSVKLLFCSNDPIELDSCTVPGGLDVSGATLVLQNGLIDMSVQSSTSNSMVLTRPPTVVVAPLTVVFSLRGVVNPSSIGSYYLRVSTYTSTDASGSSVDFGGLAFPIVNSLSLSTRVPPYLTFCSGVTIAAFDCSQATGDYLKLGNVSAATSSSASSQFMVATNAGNGYNVQVSGTTLTSGNNTIPALAVPDVSRPGSSQFGINLRANTDPAVGADPVGPGQGTVLAPYSTPDHFVYKSSDSIAGSPNAEDYRKFTVSYLVNVSTGQAAGVYSSTITYVCTPNF